MSPGTLTVPAMRTTVAWPEQINAPDSVYGTVRDRYVNGECHGLALAIRDLTGWTAEGWVDEESGFGHCYIRLPDGRLLDIDGIHTDGYSTFEHDPNDELTDWGDYDPANATYWAHRLLDFHSNELQ